MEYKLDARYVLCKFTRVHNTKADATQLCKIFSSPVLLFSNEQKLSNWKQKIFVPSTNKIARYIILMIAWLQRRMSELKSCGLHNTE